MLWWILGGIIVYIQTGYWYGRLSLRVWKKGKSKGMLPYLCFPCHARRGGIGHDCLHDPCESTEAYRAIRDNTEQDYLKLLAGIGLVKLIFCGSIIFGYLIADLFHMTVFGPPRLLSSIGSLATGKVSLAPMGKRVGALFRALGTRLADGTGSLAGVYLAAKERKYLQLSPTIDADERQKREYETAAQRLAEIEKCRLALDAEAETLTRTHPDISIIQN